MANAWCKCCDKVITDFDEPGFSCVLCGGAICERCVCEGESWPIGDGEVCTRCVENMASAVLNNEKEKRI